MLYELTDEQVLDLKRYAAHAFNAGDLPKPEIYEALEHPVTWAEHGTEDKTLKQAYDTGVRHGALGWATP